MPRKIKVAIFASGNGSNAQSLIDHARLSDWYEVKLIVSNNADAFVLKRAKASSIEAFLINTASDYTLPLLQKLRDSGIDLIALAGYLKLIPHEVLHAFPGRIVNIHPALLPEFGGKGMYGHKVHEEVLRSGKGESGVTVHIIDEHFDRGIIIRQERIPVDPAWTAAELKEEIHKLEHRIYPAVVEDISRSLLQKG